MDQYGLNPCKCDGHLDKLQKISNEGGKEEFCRH